MISRKMPQPERLAAPAILAAITAALATGKFHLSGKTDQWIKRHDLTTDIVIDALLSHIASGAKVHAKTYPTGSTGVQGNVRLPHSRGEDAYFEIKRMKDGAMFLDLWWVQVHSHDTGYPPLSR